MAVQMVAVEWRGEFASKLPQWLPLNFHVFKVIGVSVGPMMYIAQAYLGNTPCRDY